MPAISEGTTTEPDGTRDLKLPQSSDAALSITSDQPDFAERVDGPLWRSYADHVPPP